jgi:hypothetical protein
MKQSLDTHTLSPKITPKSHQDADSIFGSGFCTEHAKYVAAHYAREQYLEADGLARSIRENSPVNLNPMDIIGKTRDEVQAIFEEKLGKLNKRAGVRTLVSKYGHETAAAIVKKHSGRTI